MISETLLFFLKKYILFSNLCFSRLHRLWKISNSINLELNIQIKVLIKKFNHRLKQWVAWVQTSLLYQKKCHLKPCVGTNSHLMAKQRNLDIKGQNNSESHDSNITFVPILGGISFFNAR